jgi:hypothetical protein
VPQHRVECELAHLGFQTRLKCGTVEDWVNSFSYTVAGVHPRHRGRHVVVVEIERRQRFVMWAQERLWNSIASDLTSAAGAEPNETRISMLCRKFAHLPISTICSARDMRTAEASMRMPLAKKKHFTLLSKSTPLQQAAFQLLGFDPKRVQ